MYVVVQKALQRTESASQIKYYLEKMHCVVDYRLQFGIIIDFIPIYISRLLLLTSLRLGSVERFVGRSLFSLWI
jgi:hypothetical protein